MHIFHKDETIKNLVQAAEKAQKKSIAPYSSFCVGAALETPNGVIYQAGNIESSSYGLTICAERLAIFKALSEGEREFQRLGISTDTELFCSPCGACRQVLWDYAPKLEIILINKSGAIQRHALKDLIPEAFDGRFLKVRQSGKDVS